MQRAWDRTNSIESAKKGHTKMLGKGQSGGYLPETTSEALQSITAVPLDNTDKKGLQVGIQLPGSVQTGPQQQNQQLLLTPASLQLAQLQAQLALHRLKLAQGGNTATAATVLSQVLSNVNMSQPLFNQLRTSSMVGNPQGAFPTGVLGFPSSNSALGALVGGGFSQNPGNVRLSHPCGGGTMGQEGEEFGKKSGSTYPCDTDRRLQYNFSGGTSAASATAGDGQYSVINTQAKNVTNVGFHRDFYGQDLKGQQAGYNVNEQRMNIYNSTGHKEQWKGHANLTHTGKVDMVSNPTVWAAAGQPVRSRTELYNPEEPTPDPKLICSTVVSSFGSSGTQGFGGYQPLHGSEETLSSGTRILQPYQVNDFHAVTPTQLPHQCSICDKKVYNLKDWDQHVKGKLHLLATDVLMSVGQIIGQIFICMFKTTWLLKVCIIIIFYFQPFPPRKATAGRVVHICNLPEGSCTENDVINLGLPFGKVTNYILMRSTHQAFLEMAYMEAAQAMVQYYQLTPAMINNQKLLIRMSKRYKELQLKKPGKDVQSIIQDITSQRERDEMQEVEHYMPERARSRSPISRSLSPHSHSPSFTSCSSAHSPQGAACRGPERGSNGLGPHRSSWDWPRERDDPWRNGSSVDDERPNGRASDRRKTYQKPLDHLSLRSADERGGGGGGGGGEGMKGSRDWHPRGSPQGFNSYRNMEDDFYMEQVYKSDKPPRPPYQRHDTKSKRRDGGDYHSRSRHSDSRRHTTAEKQERENTTENTVSNFCSCALLLLYIHHALLANIFFLQDRHSKEKSVSPQQSNKSKEATECSKDTKKEWESAEDTDEECWYPKNMEELVTVDEVGEEDDSIIEPDLSELEEFASCPKAVVESVEEHVSPSASSLEVQQTSNEKSKEEESCLDIGDQVATTEKAENRICLSHNLILPFIDIEAPSPSREQDKTVSEHSIPLGVEFIVPRTGFYCKLCGLFYTSEETAKTSHCRSTVHYRNLQVNTEHTPPSATVLRLYHLLSDW
uniref:RNA binding motif protein 20 n=1 Tax=Amphiprion ocellaris TaxID=80972 RepID=A0AAQ5XUM7_AMPOC